MAILFENSRYLQVDLDEIHQYAVGETNPNRPTRTDLVLGRRATVLAEVAGSETYRLSHNETLAQVAYKYYGRPDLWYIIADANPQVFDVIGMSSGTLLTIPPRDVVLTLTE